MIESSLRAIIAGLNGAQVRYLVVGPLAVAAHGCMPYTENVELSLVLGAECVDRALRCLEGLGYRRFVPRTAAELAEAARRARLEEDEFARALRLRRGQREEIGVNVVWDDRLDFEEMYAQAEWFELAAGVAVPVCAYADLVRLKRQSGRSNDRVDLDQLEKARRARPAYDPWYECTFEGNELWQLWRWADLTLGEKIRSLEGAREVCRMFHEARRQ